MIDIRPVLFDALSLVAAMDPDRARFQNGVGFSGADGGVGHALVAVPADAWTDEMVKLAAQLVVRYQGQIGSAISPENLDAARALAADASYAGRSEARGAAREQKRVAARADIVIEIVGAKIRVTLPGYDAAVVNALKAVPGRAYSAGANLFPLASADALAETLDAFGLDTDILRAVKPTAVAEAPKNVSVAEVEGSIIVRFPYDPARVSAIKSILGARFADGGDKRWVVPARQADKVLAFARSEGLTYDAALEALADGVADKRDATIAASRATNADIEIPGLAPDITLQDFQKAGVAYTLAKRRALIADEMGLGKTPRRSPRSSQPGPTPPSWSCRTRSRPSGHVRSRSSLPPRRSPS